MRLLVTGGTGFIGSAVACRFIAESSDEILVFDKLTSAGNLGSLVLISQSPRYSVRQADICDRAAVVRALAEFQPDILRHLAAESRVDRSIDGPLAFIETNVVGTFGLLDVALEYWRALPKEKTVTFGFQHISTDEAPYSASKAGSDHLVCTWLETYGLPPATNNYDAFHFLEKLMPFMILNGLKGRPLLPVNGRGENIRDWLFVDDRAAALVLVARQGVLGETYNVGGRNENKNIDVAHTICDILDVLHPSPGDSYRNLITFVTDCPGHNLRYAVDCAKIERELELGWRPHETFETGCARPSSGIPTTPTVGRPFARVSIAANGLDASPSALSAHQESSAHRNTPRNTHAINRRH